MDPGSSETTKLPDSLEGIRFTVARMVKMIQEARKDPLVIATARKISALSASSKKLKAATKVRRQLLGIHAWCRANFHYVRDPVNIELIQTPNRMLRELQIPPQLHKAIWRQVDNVSIISKMPAPKMTGDADEMTVLSLSLAAAIGIDPIKIRVGGTDGVIHTCWGSASTGDGWVDIDVLHSKLGSYSAPQVIENFDVPM